jgi:ABC-type lipoprotein release transport system permease subunit
MPDAALGAEATQSSLPPSAAALASYVPAYRAANIDPIETLRTE